MSIFDQNLLSVSQMMKNGYSVNFKNSCCSTSNAVGSKEASLNMMNNGFYLKLAVANASAFCVTEDDSVKWHKRFGRFNYRTLKHMYTTR